MLKFCMRVKILFKKTELMCERDKVQNSNEIKYV